MGIEDREETMAQFKITASGEIVPRKNAVRKPFVIKLMEFHHWICNVEKFLDFLINETGFISVCCWNGTNVRKISRGHVLAFIYLVAVDKREVYSQKMGDNNAFI